MAKKKRSNRSKAKPKSFVTTSDVPAETTKSDAKSDADEAKKPAKPAKQRGAGPSRVEAAPEPVFWFGFEVSWPKLATARVVLFVLLALDAVSQLSHAPRYGAGDFNVAHFGFLDSLGPGRVGYGVGQLLVAYLFTLVAFGVATRVVLPIATAIYAWLYFGSQLDSYQHHYLVALVLGMACFVPWQRPANPKAPVRAWAVRLILVQLAIMYLWAAISKLDPAWLNGAALDNQLTGTMRSLVEGTVGFSAMAVMVIVVECVLAATVWIKRLAFIAAPLGILFHLGIVFTGLEIGLFSYLMVGTYILVVPDRVWTTLARQFVDLGETVRFVGTRPGFVVTGAGIAVALGLAWLVRLPHAFALAIVLAIVSLAIAFRSRVAAVGIAHVVAVAIWLVVDRATPIAEDYYRYWGGSQRRIGDTATAEIAYRKLVEIAPDKEVGHFQLGRILLATDRADEGLEELHAAQRVDPRHARAFAEEARWLARSGRQAEALAKAKEAVAAEPSDLDAKSLLDSLDKKRPAPPRKSDPE